MSPRLAFAIETAVLAGKSTLGLFHAGREYSLKDNATPVTAADLEAERLVRAEIARRYPNEPILGEEEGGDLTAANRWVVDPIDGTKSFICGVPLYATLLAYEEDAVPVLGVAYFPALDEIVFAERGQGATWNSSQAHVSATVDLSRAVVCCGSHAGMENHGRTAGFLSLAQRCLATRTWCDAYGHMLVATGRVDAMVDPIVARWDISAMAVIVREAGGCFTDFLGSEALSTEAVSCTPGLKGAVLGSFEP